MNMDGEGADNKISNDSQSPTYITYYSGWPSLLEVTYNRETGKSQLEDYPSISPVPHFRQAKCRKSLQLIGMCGRIRLLLLYKQFRLDTFNSEKYRNASFQGM